MLNGCIALPRAAPAASPSRVSAPSAACPGRRRRASTRTSSTAAAATGARNPSAPQDSCRSPATRGLRARRLRGHRNSDGGRERPSTRTEQQACAACVRRVTPLPSSFTSWGLKMLRSVSIVVVVIASGCAAYGAYGKLDEDSKADFEVCRQSISKAQCGSTSAEASASGGSGISYAMCLNPLIEQYAAAPKPQRKAWLVRHGCPKDMVGQ